MSERTIADIEKDLSYYGSQPHVIAAMRVYADDVSMLIRTIRGLEHQRDDEHVRRVAAEEKLNERNKSPLVDKRTVADIERDIELVGGLRIRGGGTAHFDAWYQDATLLLEQLNKLADENARLTGLHIKPPPPRESGGLT